MDSTLAGSTFRIAAHTPARVRSASTKPLPPSSREKAHEPHKQPKWLGAGSSRNLVLRLGFEIAGVVTFVQLAGELPPSAVDLAPSLHSGARGDRVAPTLDMCVFLYLQEFARLV